MKSRFAVSAITRFSLYIGIQTDSFISLRPFQTKTSQNQQINQTKENEINQSFKPFPNEKLLKEYQNILHLHLQFDYGPPQLCSGLKILRGELLVTNARIIYKVSTNKRYERNDGLFTSPKQRCIDEGFDIPIPLFYSIKQEKVLLPSLGDFYCVTVTCKNYHTFHLAFFEGNKAEELEHVILNSVSGRRTINELFYFRGNYDHTSYVDEMNRLQWKENNQLKSYRLNIKTYPEIIILPTMSEHELQQIIQFRSKGRIPAITYYHKTNGIILRSSQPMVGLKMGRCLSDEKLLEKCALISKNQKLFIIDCRPKLAASANLLKGMGYEDIKNYNRCELMFLDIDNIHKMRESYNNLKDCIKLLQYNHISENEEQTLIHNTKWLYYLNKIMKGSCISVEKYLQGNTILIHCSDGWDRTSQIISLSELIVDPYYRTIQGFQRLIDKDWISFGHKFGDRCRHLISTQSMNEYSPVFLQFIDCVYQLQRLFPNEFQFNDIFLIEIVQQIYTCYFGNFLFNGFQKIEPKPESLWNVMNNHAVISRFTNQRFHPTINILPLQTIQT